MANNGRHWLFDLDNTVYPAASGLFALIDERINLYLQEHAGIAPERADFTRRDYFHRYGLTLLGLMEEHGTDPAHYLEYVHRVPVAEVLGRNGRLRSTLRSIAAPKSIFTNGSREHSRTVLRALGIEDCFGEIFDITGGEFIAKPDPRAYRAVLETLGADASRSVLVEDLPQNLLPAKDLGMTTILVGRTEAVPGADYVLAEVEELADILDELEG